ncbi:MAG: ferredoxin--NADP reductase [Bacteroidia bacterium]|nr:ferredoxin--NADP reductase [Bacteroidia bacterium]
MSLQFQSLTVKKVIWETPDALSIVFEKPRTAEFHYKSGQYLTLQVPVNGENLRRAYSLCSSPFTDEDLIVTVKQVADGRVSNALSANLKEGDSMLVYPPMGNFTVETKPSNEKHYIMIGGGSGITPLLSMIKTILQMEPGSRISLIYANRDEKSIIFKSTLDALLAKFGAHRIKIIHALDNPPADWTGLKGPLDKSVLLQICQDLVSSDKRPAGFYLCGPAGMMEEAKKALAFLGIGKADIHQELFTAPLPKLDEERASTGDAANFEPKRGTYEVQVHLDGSDYTITVPADMTILEVAIEEGLDPPYACQMGICTTCRAKCQTGVIEMEETEGLSDAELEEGYVLTCQSHPMTPNVKVTYG